VGVKLLQPSASASGLVGSLHSTKLLQPSASAITYCWSCWLIAQHQAAAASSFSNHLLLVSFHHLLADLLDESFQEFE